MCSQDTNELDTVNAKFAGMVEVLGLVGLSTDDGTKNWVRIVRGRLKEPRRSTPVCAAHT
jgi:hypothetical protein